MELYDFFTSKELYITNQPGADIQVEEPVKLLLTKKDLKDSWNLHILDGDVIVNYFYPEEKEIKLVEGSIIQLGQTTLKLFNDELHVLEGQIETSLTRIKKSAHVLPKDYPDYHRSPRIIKRAPKDKITVENPPAPIQKNNQGLLKTILPPLVMVGVSIVMALIRANALFMLMSLATTSVTVVMAIVEFFKNKKQYKHDVKARKEKYTEYFEDKEKQIYQVQKDQRGNAFYHYPSPNEIFKMVGQYDSRIYEKKADDFDFLTYRLGLGTAESSAEINNSGSSSIDLDDPLMEQAYRLVNNKQTLNNMPITTDLMHQPVGYVGPKDLVVEQLQWMLCQLATFQSYHDVRFIAVFNEDDYDKWSWLRWLKQFNLPELKMTGFVFDAKSRDTIMNYLNQILKDRQNELNQTSENEQKKMKFAPRYVLIVEDERLILDHAIMEILGAEPEKLGLSLVYVKDVMSSLPENIKTVIDIRDRHTGELVMEQGKLLQKQFKLDHLDNENKELMSRQLASLNHLETLKSSVPEKLTFMQMYGVKTVEDLNITQRWNEHSPYKTLAVPLGVSGPDEIVDLNLHERAHGPHGLIAGTTGSGKSELIQSYILSLAVNFHPYDVAFLLIDYKGGGMANLFKDLPHLVGTITNLDKAQSMRALESINAELKKRQRLFAKYNVNHINAYQKLFKEGKAEEPMPHLFMISDEFAELKSEQPDFMDELISTARIGRSLGVHLILATQKPAGVVNDQIWSNSNFKISLKVSDKEDSMEVLKTPDAASITLPGRAYLEVGNNELYELFQSAYSGADYRPDEDDTKQSFLIKKINKMGQQQVISQDLSGLDETGHVEKVPTQLEAVVNKVHDLFEESGAKPLAQPWLPPLRKWISIAELDKRDFHEEWNKPKEPLKAVIGQVDIPSEQAQRPVSVNLTETGNLAVFASAGNGKSTFLQTLVMQLARTHTPEELNIYLLDFGTNGLQPLRDLPQVADIMTADEEEKIVKFVSRMKQITKNRKRLFSQEAVANVSMYERKTGKILPEVMVVIDNFEGFNDTKYEELLISLITSLTRDGSSVGIHVVISAGSTRSLRSRLMNNIKQRIALKQNNADEILEIVGKNKLEISDYPGRGLIKLDEVRLMQAALPSNGMSNMEVLKNLENEVNSMNNLWKGERPKEIPIIPDDLYVDDFIKDNKVKEIISDGGLALGLEYAKVTPVSFNPKRVGNLGLFGNNDVKFKALKLGVLESLNMQDKIRTIVFNMDNIDNIKKYTNIDGIFTTDDEVREAKDNLATIYQQRKDSNNDWIYVYITDAQKFKNVTQMNDYDFEMLIANGIKKNIAIIIADNRSNFGMGSIYEKYIDNTLFTLKGKDQMYYQDLSYDLHEKNIEKGQANFVYNGEMLRIKVIS